jgi:hypothetical protein
MKEPKTEGPYLYLEIDSRHESKQWAIRLVRTEDGKIRNYTSENRYDNFVVKGYFYNADDLRSNQERKSNPVFAWEYGYVSPYFVDTERAEAMLGFLRSTNKAIGKQREAYGVATSFAEYVVRVAQAVKAVGYVRKSANGRNTWNYDDTDHVFMTAAEARYFIESEHREHIRAILGESEAA